MPRKQHEKGLSGTVLPPEREWSQARGGWSAVVQIAEGRRASVFKAAKAWKESDVGVVLVPYLSRASMLLRRERTEVFGRLAAAGANPKWEGSAGIRYSDGNGMRRLYDFDEA